MSAIISGNNLKYQITVTTLLPHRYHGTVLTDGEKHFVVLHRNNHVALPC